MKEAPKASQSRIPRLILQNPKDFSASFPESFHAFDNNHTTIRSHPPSFPVSPSGHRPLFPKPKAQSPEPVFPLHFVQNVFFPPATPKNHDFFLRQHPDFVQNVQSPHPPKEKISDQKSSIRISWALPENDEKTKRQCL